MSYMKVLYQSAMNVFSLSMSYLNLISVLYHCLIPLPFVIVLSIEELWKNISMWFDLFHLLFRMSLVRRVLALRLPWVHLTRHAHQWVNCCYTREIPVCSFTPTTKMRICSCWECSVFSVIHNEGIFSLKYFSLLCWEKGSEMSRIWFRVVLFRWLPVLWALLRGHWMKLLSTHWSARPWANPLLL